MSSAAQLDDILDCWANWQAGISQRPIVVGKLSNGLVSQCWHIASENKNFVIRFSSRTIEEINCRWEEELQAAKMAAALGITPGVVYASDKNKAMVLEWGGEVATAKRLRSEECLARLAKALRQLHQTPAQLNTPGYEQTLTLYARRIPGNGLSRVDQDILKYARYLDGQHQHLVFCHHDLSIGNILLLPDKIQLVDWEYARIGHALFDLASLVESAELNEAQSRFLLGEYGAPKSFMDDMPRMLGLIHHLGDLWESALAS